ncbi:MAG TPA: NAD(P)-dependent oxidoreductase [Bacteroidales bacterium]|nr:NAD(P)-dependent oxidoreductase [Bacteroidales bacterium]
MARLLKVGILRETRNPADRRVPLTPPQIVALEELYPNVEFFVQPSDFRCYSNEEYEYLDIPLKEDLRECDILMGVKEVDKRTFIPGKTYLFFAHVAKKQPHNLDMFRAMTENNLRLIDFEYLTTDEGQRVVAFGRYAGIVGAYNGLRARGIKTNKFKLKPAYQCHDLEEMWAGLRLIELNPQLKILLTGDGRVTHGAIETLGVANVVQVSPEDYLKREFDVPVFCQIKPEHYTRHKNELPFNFSHFVKSPVDYESTFLPYASVTDILITGHFWDPRSPVFFTREDMKKTEFRISIVADISCDINGGIPSTLRATTISDPFYAYNPFLETEEPAFSRQTNITVMSIDNLPGELPRDASLDFGKQLMGSVLQDLLSEIESPMISRATILKAGKLTFRYDYLNDYLNGV